MCLYVVCELSPRGIRSQQFGLSMCWNLSGAQPCVLKPMYVDNKCTKAVAKMDRSLSILPGLTKRGGLNVIM